MIPWPGGFTAWHEPPTIDSAPGSRIRDGQKVLLSYFHTAIIYDEQVMCCMAEPKLYDILRWQIEQVHKHLQPDGYFLQHDEIRVQGWDESCRRTGKTPGELLAENVAKCIKLVRSRRPRQADLRLVRHVRPEPQRPKVGPLLSGQRRWPVVRLLEGPGQGRGDRQLELRARQADRVAAAFRRTWAIGKFSPAITTARSTRFATGSATASKCPASSARCTRLGSTSTATWRHLQCNYRLKRIRRINSPLTTGVNA